MNLKTVSFQNAVCTGPDAREILFPAFAGFKTGGAAENFSQDTAPSF